MESCDRLIKTVLGINSLCQSSIVQVLYLNKIKHIINRLGIMQFFEIILSRKEAKLLRAAENAPVACSVRNIEQISRLEALGLIQSDFVCQVSGENLSAKEDLFCLTDAGRSYFAYCKAGSRKLFWEWFRYGVTTLIALAALLQQ